MEQDFVSNAKNKIELEIGYYVEVCKDVYNQIRSEEVRSACYTYVEEECGLLLERAVHRLRQYAKRLGYNPPKPKTTRRSHDLFCTCRKCNPSTKTWLREMSKA